jgi:hypothetical protein
MQQPNAKHNNTAQEKKHERGKDKEATKSTEKNGERHDTVDEEKATSTRGGERCRIN